MKKLILLLLIAVSFKSYSQANGSDCSNIDAQYAKEASALEAKYFEYSPNPKKFTREACNDHVPRDYCKLHHKQCGNFDPCYAIYLKEIQTLQSKYDVKKQLCEERAKKQQEIAIAKWKRRQQEAAANAAVPGTSTSTGKTSAGNNYITIDGVTTRLMVQCNTESEMMYSVGHQVQFRSVHLTDKQNPPYNIDISVREYWATNEKAWEMDIIYNNRNYVVNDWGAKTGQNIYHGTILTDRKDAPYPNTSATIAFAVTCF